MPSEKISFVRIVTVQIAFAYIRMDAEIGRRVRRKFTD